MFPSFRQVSTSIFAATAILGLAACSTHQARRVKTSGFLSDYSILKKGHGEEALLTYVNEGANFAKYNKIILEPIAVFPSKNNSQLARLDAKGLTALTNYFDAAIRSELSKDYTFVPTPGPDVMRMRVALSEADSAYVALDLVTSVVPFALATSTLKTAVTGKGTGLGEASAEIEVTDSLTGQVLAAAVDKRVGNKFTGEFDKLDRWRAAKGAFDAWANRISVRLAELRRADGGR